MEQFRNHEPSCADLGGTQMCRGQGLVRTSSSSFRLQPLRAAIVVAILAVPAFAAVDSASEFGISTYGRFRARRYFRPFKGRVLALGPLVGKTVDLWKLPFTFTVKYDVEFAAQNRSTGNELWLTGGFQF